MKKPLVIVVKTTDKHLYFVEGEWIDEFLNEESGTYDSIPASFWAHLYLGGKKFSEDAYFVLGCDVDKTWAV